MTASPACPELVEGNYVEGHEMSQKEALFANMNDIRPQFQT